MLKNYLLIFLRKTLRRKAFAAINIGGLSVSFAGAILIYMYVVHELSFDRFHENSHHIFRMYAAYSRPGDAVEEFAYTPPNLGPLLADNFGSVRTVTRLFETEASMLVQSGDKSFSEQNVFEADSSFFSVFTGKFIEGNPANALSTPNSAVMSQSAAERIFGNVNTALDKELKTNDRSYTITGIVEDFPNNSHIQFTLLLSIDYSSENLTPGNWLSHWPATYVLLEHDADVKTVQDQLRSTTEKILDPIYRDRFGKSYSERKAQGGLQEYRFQPLEEVHLHSAHMGEKGNIVYVYIFIAIGAMLVCIAAFNYINLSTARSTWEARSTGVRKVLGATKSQLYKQFLTESVMVSVLAALLGIGISQGTLIVGSSFFGQFIPGTHVPVSMCLIAIGVAVIVGLLSGSLPARLLNAFQPTQALKGQLTINGKGNGLRQVLVTAQFVISISLIVCTLVMTRQLTFMRDRPLGFDKEHLLIVKNVGSLDNRKSTLKEKLLNENYVINASLCNGTLGIPGNSAAFTPVELIEQHQGDIVVGIRLFVTDNDYLPTLNARLLMGHDFPEGLTKERQQIILNKEALRAIGWEQRSEKDVIGKMIDVNGNRYELAGIVDDYHYVSLHEKITPMAILSHYWSTFDKLMIRLRPSTTAQAIDGIRNHWMKIAPDVPFDYTFVDEDLYQLYSSEQNLASLFVGFAGVAIFVACLGLLGLAMFAAEKSVKEIGIRKVLGASVTSIVVRLSRSMILLVMIAFAVATPITWFLMDRWLENFPYRSGIDVSLFVIAGGLTVMIAIATISYQATRAAVANPVDSLKAE